jgi:hypothetical protein
VAAASKVVGESKARAMVTEIPQAILDNKALPDWGEPENPLRRKTWTQRLIGMPRRTARAQGGGGGGVRRAASRPTTILRVK